MAERLRPVRRAPGSSGALFGKLGPGPGVAPDRVAAHQRTRLQGR